jgi:hypothetical protein
MNDVHPNREEYLQLNIIRSKHSVKKGLQQHHLLVLQQAIIPLRYNFHRMSKKWANKFIEKNL